MTGIIQFPRATPEDSVQWAKLFRDLNRVLTRTSNAYQLDSDTQLDDRDTAIQTVLQYVSNGGRATDQRLLNMITFGNAPSVQSAIPLTASADAVTATIQVGSHTLYYGGRTISYNSGTVSGLVPSTDYYVYTDDSELAGGAVTYQATTNYVNLASSVDRYLVGAIRTPMSSISASLAAATNANPCAVTTGAAHGFTTGDQVTFTGVGGMTQLNTLPATAITVTGATTFTLDGVDSTAYGVYTAGGTVTRVTTPADGLGGGAGYGYIYDIGIYY